MDYARYAELFGLMGMWIDRPEDVETVCAAALGAKRPVVIDVRADPNVVALPPHATLEQTTKFFASLVKGDVDRLAVLKQLAL